MKKLLVAIAMVAGAFTANAQDVKFGVKGGLNIANLRGDEVSNNIDARTSFHFGGVVEIELSDKFSLQPELVYSSQGAKWTEDFGGTDVDMTMKLDYLNIPVIAKYYVAEGFSLEAGPQLGININSEVEAEALGNSASEDLDAKSIDFALNFGAGYKLENGLNFGVRYNLGLSNLPEEGDANTKNGVFQVSVGYMF